MLKVINFFSSHFWKILFFGLLLLLTTVYAMRGITGIWNLYYWFKGVSYNDNANLVTIVTVLIGIYFSLYTYLLSADSNSFLAKIRDKAEFYRLVKMINIGFSSSMVLVLLSFINAELFKIFCHYYILFLFLDFILIFGSLIEIFLYYSLLFKRDLESRYNYFQSIKSNEEEEKKLARKLKDFLERQNIE
ncbi:hypothetical protein [Enterococcus faecium]|jgi:hypothetical protein|uniref:hypothetical protein n=1 Tax=Enterococcus faecium TaxID=1352 RepID=UPI00202CCF12|nr:hypothetical protein [Enterococcus faecium]EME3528779.1 hypothetical protein [Enterococcus faecium]MCL9979267.1 hypothetical protein [Enterococcus faecium]MEB7477942.1 hypothetical protein [Enterococcus faecium]MEB8313912.1 hypothetical protein [Enterococcus faecium]MEB8450452.1 hypothetical protein [Enterococcus faecium]